MSSLQEKPTAPSASKLAAAEEEMHRLLTLLLDSGGSDLHLRVGHPPILRKDGQLVREDGPDLDEAKLYAMLLSTMTARDMAIFEENSDVDYAYEVEGVARFRCNAGVDRGGSLGVFRIIPSRIPTCDELELGKAMRDLCSLNKGLVLVTGPTGSGKSTTLAALLDLVNQERSQHILTIEDPVEFVHTSKNCLVTHRQVGVHTRSFRSGLRAALREDPDVVLIGEMRDLETVETAMATAETGHLVFGTLHTTTAPSTIDRIIDQFPAERQAQIRVMLAESLRGVIAQVLCRKIGGGRIAAHEVLLYTRAVANLIREGKTFQLPSIIQTNRERGMMTLNDSLLDLVHRELVEPAEAYLRSTDKDGLETSLRASGHKLEFLD